MDFMSLRSKNTIKPNEDERNFSTVVVERRKKLESYDTLKFEGCTISTILRTLEVSLSTIKRWKRAYKNEGMIGLEPQDRTPRRVRTPRWTAIDEAVIVATRKKYPLFGKNKIAIMAKVECGVTLSVSAVGRIITKNLKRGTIKPVSLYYNGRLRSTRPRVFNGHAKRWQAGMRSSAPGDLVQVDHATITLGCGETVKHFTAICPTTKYVCYQTYIRATSFVASKFFRYMEKTFPFSIKSLQVDGGSEFAGEFEHICKVKNVPLYVLPPRSPELNGAVERANATAKYEFYRQYSGASDLWSVRQNLRIFNEFYNNVRPHQGLNYLTPASYYNFSEAFRGHMY